MPEIEELVRRPGPPARPDGRQALGGEPSRRPARHRTPAPTLSHGGRGAWGLVAIGAAVVWSFMSFYTVDEGERSVELLFGRPYAIGTPGLNFAPWPAVTKEIVQATASA